MIELPAAHGRNLLDGGRQPPAFQQFALDLLLKLALRGHVVVDQPQAEHQSICCAVADQERPQLASHPVAHALAIRQLKLGRDRGLAGDCAQLPLPLLMAPSLKKLSQRAVEPVSCAEAQGGDRR